MNPAEFIDRLSASVAQHPLVAVLVAIAGGLFSTGTCPCTLPAGVGIVGYVGTRRDGRNAGARSGLRLGLAFFAGLVLALLVLGTAASVFGRLLAGWRRGFAAAAALLTAAAGIAVLAGPAFRRAVPDPVVPRRGGLSGAFVYGTLFSLATITTSAGPLLLLLTVAAAIGNPVYGALLSLAYAVGRGAPFLALAAFSGGVQQWLERVERFRRPFEIASGVALVGVAAYFLRIAMAGY